MHVMPFLAFRIVIDIIVLSVSEYIFWVRNCLNMELERKAQKNNLIYSLLFHLSRSVVSTSFYNFEDFEPSHTNKPC